MAFCCTAFNSRTHNSCGTSSSSTLEIFTEASRLSNPLRHLSFSPDGSLFASLGEVRCFRRPLLISSTIKPSRFGTEFRLQLSQTSHSSICRFPALSCTCNGNFPSTSNSCNPSEIWSHGLRDMENVLFTITIDNTVTAWAPINSWEPHVLYQRASISMHTPQFDGASTIPHLSHFWILVDNSELTRALETVFNKSDREKNTISDDLDTISDIARKSPEVCIALDQTDDRLLVWGIDVLISS
jgi:hypothetical protein